MWWKAEVQGLHRIQDRVSTVYVERCHIDRAENAVVFVNKERTVRVPASMIAAMLVGPGTRITHGAVGLLADSGTSVCWVGEHGVRMYAAGLSTARGAQVVQRQAELVSNQKLRICVAREMYQMRFPGEDVSTATMQQLRGREGARVKKQYKKNSKRTGVPWTGRKYVHGDAFAVGDDVNRLISAGNAVLYAVCHAATVGVGASPALGFVHVGSALSFVLDVADLYKADLVVPLAFDLVAAGRTEEADIRQELRNHFHSKKFMPRVVRDILTLLMGDQVVSFTEGYDLWDEFKGVVDGGVNWDDDEGDFEYLVLSGPDVGKAEEF